MGRFSVRPSVHTSVRTSEAHLAGSEACLAGSKACLAGSWALEGGTDGHTDGHTNGRTENLPILQDFVPYRGRCPKRKGKIKERKKKEKDRKKREKVGFSERNSISHYVGWYVHPSVTEYFFVYSVNFLPPLLNSAT